MSITDELREYALGWDERNRVRRDLEHIADRIDAEHQKALDEWKAEHGQMWLRGYAECHAELLEGNETLASDLEGCGWIRLPKDADGKTIHLQDRMSWDNGTFNVHELKLDADGWTTWDELHGYTVRADQCHHVQPDSWERIISDATALGAQMKRRTHQVGDFVERCKRLAGEDA